MQRDDHSASGNQRSPNVVLDTLQTFETPEGVELALRLAGPAPRAVAWLVDGVIKLVLLGLSSLFTVLGDFGSGLILIYGFAVLWLYNVLFEIYADGSTPGKKLLALRVVNGNGTPVGWHGAVIRNLIRVVDLLPVCYGLGVLTCLLNSRFQRLGDMAADTVVVHFGAPPAAPVRAAQSAVAPAIPLSLDEQRWIMAFSDRGPQLTSERAVELAEILQPLIGESGNATVAKLYANGNWLAGRS